MGYYMLQAGSFPPNLLTTLLDNYEYSCREELQREHPDVPRLLRLQEEIEDIADEMDIAIIWGERSEGATAEMSGKSFGIYYMPDADPTR